jgi:2-oxoglutarate dehydrogenase E1 component
MHIVSKAFEAPPGKAVKAAIKATIEKMANVGID